MTRALLRISVASLTLLAVLAVLHPRHAQAKILPLRSGTVVAKRDANAFSYIEAVDQEGKKFWVLTAICVLGQGGTIEVLAGTHYDQVRSEQLDAVFEDVYTAQKILVNGQEVEGFGAHGLPEGCVTAR